MITLENHAMNYVFLMLCYEFLVNVKLIFAFQHFNCKLLLIFLSSSIFQFAKELNSQCESRDEERPTRERESAGGFTLFILMKRYYGLKLAWSSSQILEKYLLETKMFQELLRGI
jgi:hypothetical protein